MLKAEEDQYLEQENSASPSNDVLIGTELVAGLSPGPLSSRIVENETLKTVPPLKPITVVYQPVTQAVRSSVEQLKAVTEPSQSPMEVDNVCNFTKITDMINNTQIPNKYRIQAKVIDHMPHEISNFTKSVCITCRKRYFRKLTSSFLHSDKVGCPLCKSDKYPRSIYNFSFLVEDDTGQVPLVFHGTPATNFLQLPPTRLTSEALGLVNAKLEKLFEKGDLVRVERGFMREWIVESYSTIKGIRYRISEDQPVL